MKDKSCLLILMLHVLLPVLAQQPDASATRFRTVHLDKKGVIRWENNEEVALNDANFTPRGSLDGCEFN